MGATLAWGTITLATPEPARSDPARNYELVSPADDRQYDVNAPGSGARIKPFGAEAQRSSPDGAFATFDLGIGGGWLPGLAPDGEIADYFVAARGATSWESAAPLGDRSSVGGCLVEGDNVQFDTISDDGAALLLRFGCQTDKRLFSGGFDLTGRPPTLYHVDVVADAATFVGARYGASGQVPRMSDLSDLFVGGSRDLATVYFATQAGLLPGVTDSAGTVYLYRRTGGETTLITRAASGAPFGVRGDPHATEGGLDRRHTVSDDGTAVTLTALEAGRMLPADTNAVADVYQVRGDRVIWASRPTRSPPSAPANRVFEGASSDGDVIILSSAEPLTQDDEDSQRDLFSFDVTSGQLSRVSTGPLNDNGDLLQDGADFVMSSDDGSRIFFISGGQLVSDDLDGGRSIYVHNRASGATSYVAPAVNPSDSDVGNRSGLVGATTSPSGRPIKLSADGRTAAFMLVTNVGLPAGHGGADTDGTRDVFVWREGLGLRRIPQGTGADANTTTAPGLACYDETNTAGATNRTRCRGLSADGDVVFFETADALVDEDDNGFVDVYAYHTADGSVELISPPSDTPFDQDNSAIYVDNSASGDDVFFLTRETLDPRRDTDGGRVDMYNARRGATFPPPPAPAEPCSGDVCQGAPSPVPARPGMESAVAEGARNAAPSTRVELSLRRPTRRELRRAARSGVLRLRVGSNRPVLVRLRARARIGARPRWIGAANRRMDGVSRVRLRLSGPARRALQHGRRLEVQVTVRAPGARPQAIELSLRRRSA